MSQLNSAARYYYTNIITKFSQKAFAFQQINQQMLLPIVAIAGFAY